MRTDKVYRGVVVTRIGIRDKYGNKMDAKKVRHLKPYDKPGPAKASVTSYRNNHSRDFLEGYVEVSTEWERL